MDYLDGIPGIYSKVPRIYPPQTLGYNTLRQVLQLQQTYTLVGYPGTTLGIRHQIDDISGITQVQYILPQTLIAQIGNILYTVISNIGNLGI